MRLGGVMVRLLKGQLVACEKGKRDVGWKVKDFIGLSQYIKDLVNGCDKVARMKFLKEVGLNKAIQQGHRPP